MSLEGLSGLVNRIIAWADRLQRKNGALGFPYAVVKKYGDDEGGRQAALITYYGYLSIFPLLLLGVAVLSRVLADHPDLRQRPRGMSGCLWCWRCCWPGRWRPGRSQWWPPRCPASPECNGGRGAGFGAGRLRGVAAWCRPPRCPGQGGPVTQRLGVPGGTAGNSQPVCSLLPAGNAPGGAPARTPGYSASSEHLMPPGSGPGLSL